MTLTFVAAIGIASITTGCSHFSKSSRQQAAYARYVAKSSNTRVKQQAKFKKVKVPNAPEHAPIITADTVQGPQSVSSSSEQ